MMMPDPSSLALESDVSMPVALVIFIASSPSALMYVNSPSSTAPLMMPSTSCARTCSSSFPYAMTSIGDEEVSAEEDGK